VALIAVPQVLENSVDAVINDFLTGPSDSGELKTRLKYFEIDGWSDLVSASNDLIAINVERFSRRYLCDPELRSHVGPRDDVVADRAVKP
jgi:hypothetical protein